MLPTLLHSGLSFRLIFQNFSKTTNVEHPTFFQKDIDALGQNDVLSLQKISEKVCNDLFKEKTTVV